MPSTPQAGRRLLPNTYRLYYSSSTPSPNTSSCAWDTASPTVARRFCRRPKAFAFVFCPRLLRCDDASSKWPVELNFSMNGAPRTTPMSSPVTYERPATSRSGQLMSHDLICQFHVSSPYQVWGVSSALGARMVAKRSAETENRHDLPSRHTSALHR